MYEAQKKYDRKNTKSFCIKLNYNTDADLISYLEAVQNVQGLIKKLLMRQMYYDTGHYVGGKENES